MTIHIEDLRFKCIIGILDFERTTPQDIIVNMTIQYEHKNEFINYADVVEIIKNDLITKKYLLIEDAIEQLSEKIKKNFPLVETLDIKISKPSIIKACTVSVSNCYSFNS